MNSDSRSTVFIKNLLGFHIPHLSTTVSISLTVISFFSIFSLATFLKPTVWVLINRVSYFSAFEGYVIDKFTDNLVIAIFTALWLGLSLRLKREFTILVTAAYSSLMIIFSISNHQALEILAILSMPLVTSLILWDRVSTKKFLIFEGTQVFNYLVLIGIVIGIVAFLISLEPLLRSYYIIPMTNLAHQIFLVFGNLAPGLLILLILSFPVKIIVEAIIIKLKNIKNKKITKEDESLQDESFHENRIKLSLTVVLLLLFMIISSCMALIPHQEAVNFDNKDVGVDTHYYVEWTKIILNSGSAGQAAKELLISIQHGDRPLSLLFFVGIAKFFPATNLSYVFDHVPVILGPALVIVIYFLTRELTSSKLIALLSAFMTSISFHILVGIYAGSYANWMALIAGYLSMTFMFRYLRNHNRKDMYLFAILSVTTLLTHSYTWTILSMFIGIFLLTMLRFNYYNRKHVINLLIIVGSIMLFDVVRMILTGSFSGISYGVSPPIGELRFGPGQFLTRWSSIIDTTQNYYGSLFGNSIIYALGVYWLLKSKLKETSTIFLISIMSIGIIPLFFGNWIVQSRVFYDIPFQIPAAFAMAYIYKKFNSVFPLIPIIIWLLAFSITALSNFHFVPPFQTN